ncbi:amino acid adenylation domain-containing protein [Streptomyces sp. BHT-5-2]|uniref:non-ribosomal peptide synthetase n=1 Tax=Streptomyces sp. BHT-5-2 TaxID=2866715 RepID=UPI001C8E32CE|nr:amino acid adenylation domain-containing protein [Streptomyces sp. BHT-5-2]QZL04780.1 amino acid adenylation domain-containing protein [Streptomyces sp. BHT-5-2]
MTAAPRTGAPDAPGDRDRLAAALLALHHVIHDAEPRVRVVPAAGAPRTVALPVDPAVSFKDFAAQVDAALTTGEPDVEAAGDVPDLLVTCVPGTARDGFRRVLDLSGAEPSAGHDGGPDGPLEAAALAEVYRTVLARAVADPALPVGGHELLRPEDRHRVLREFNATARDFPEDATLHGVFRAQAARTPDAVAVSTDTASLTYRELDERTERLAGFLVAQGIGPGDVVGVLGDRCLELPVAVLGVLKAGAAYLPLDPTVPALRLLDLVERAGAARVLAQPGVPVPDGLAAPVTYLDAPEPYAERPQAPLARGGSRDLAYVIYTSGSTGRPKGVMVEHRSVVNRLTWMQRQYPLTADDTLLQKTPFVFDVSVWELFWWFFAGARMHLLAPGMERFPLATAATVRAQGVSVLHFVPSMLGMFVDHVRGKGVGAVGDRLRWVFSSGESLSPAAVTSFNEVFADRGTRLVNLYGPTEATVDVTAYDCPPGPCEGTVPIGRPVDNTRAYVIRYGRPAPVGVWGTLFLAGAQVARGYLGDPELTARRFVRELGCGPGLMYDTGDICRWLPSGELEFLGRADDQVKIRGIRIDLGEIEGVLLEFPGITECAVVVDRPAPTVAVLRAAVAGPEGLSPREVRDHAAARLPEYMLPTVHHRFDRLPRTGSGKLDRRTLQDPAWADRHGRRW